MIAALLLLVASAPAANCADADTQSDMNACSYQRMQAADRAMNAAWVEAVASAKASDIQGPSGAFDRLLGAQRKWLAYRDAECASAIGPREQSGTIWPLEQNGCLAELTEARTKQLRDYVGGGQG